MSEPSTAEEKREDRFHRWLNPANGEFIDAQARDRYQERVSRFISAIRLEASDRVPVILPVGNFPLHYAGITLKTAMEDNVKLCDAFRRFFNDFEFDSLPAPMIGCARASEIIDSKITKWPGHGLPDTASMSQFVEGEYMQADEYDHLINDAGDFCFRRYLPRTIGALAPFADFEPLAFMLGLPHKFLIPTTNPKVRAALRAMADYGEVMEKWQHPMMLYAKEGLAAGYPQFFGGHAHAPYDILADTLRGTRGIVRDMFRQPEKMIEAMESLVAMNINCAVQGADFSGRPVVFFPLHKGDDTFMSTVQYEKFYWPTFRKVIMGVIEAGCVPLLFAEGQYHDRLDIIKDLPAGKVIWHFDRTPIVRAKSILGDTACIMGNVPASLLITGTPEAVKEHCLRLIDACGRNGGFILSGGASIDQGNPDNLHAMMAAAMAAGKVE